MIVQHSVFTGYLKVLNLVIVNEKYLTLNLSKEPNFILTFLVKSLTASICPNSQAYSFHMSDFTVS